jgi:hypothetical protein
MATFEKIEFEQFGPYRFIGKSVYARVGAEQSSEIFGGLWGNSSGIFSTLDGLTEYVTGETYNIALLTFDKYDEQKKLMGYTVGRFMKAGTPVPNDLDYFDIPQTIVAKGWVKGEFHDMIGNAEKLTTEAISKQDKYELVWDKSSFTAEVYTSETVAKGGVDSVFGYYMTCKEK